MKDTLYFAIAIFAERFVSFFLLPLLAKSIAPAEYAVWAQSVVVSGVMVPLVLLQFPTGIIKFFPAWEKDSVLQNAALLFILKIVLGALTALSLLAIFFQKSLANLIFGSADKHVFVLLLVGMLVSEAFFEIFVGVFRAARRIKKISVYFFLKGIWRIAVFSLVLFGFEGGFYGAFFSFVLFQMFAVFLIYIREMRIFSVIKSNMVFSREHRMDLLRFSVPLIPLAVLIGLNNFVDRFFIAHWCDLSVLGVYSASFSLAAIAAFFYSVLGFTLFPVLSKAWASGDNQASEIIMKKAFIMYLSLLLPFLVFMAVVGSDVMKLLTNEQYSVDASLLLAMTFSIGLFGVYQIAFYLVVLQRGGLHALYSVAAVVGVNILLNALLVPHYGMYGAALSGCISNALLSGLFLAMSRERLEWRFPVREGVYIAIRAVSVGILVKIACELFGYSGLIPFVLVVACGVLLYVFLDYADKRSSFFSVMKSF